MARPRIKLDRRGMTEMLKSDGVVEALHNEAEPVLAEALRYAPVDTGAYKSSMRIVEAETDRAVVRVVASDPKAVLIESRMGVLKRALGGKRRQIGRDRARQRRADRRQDRQTAREENEGF